MVAPETTKHHLSGLPRGSALLRCCASPVYLAFLGKSELSANKVFSGGHRELSLIGTICQAANSLILPQGLISWAAKQCSYFLL